MKGGTTPGRERSLTPLVVVVVELRRTSHQIRPSEGYSEVKGLQDGRLERESDTLLGGGGRREEKEESQQAEEAPPSNPARGPFTWN